MTAPDEPAPTSADARVRVDLLRLHIERRCVCSEDAVAELIGMLQQAEQRAERAEAALADMRSCFETVKMADGSYALKIVRWEHLGMLLGALAASQPAASEER